MSELLVVGGCAYICSHIMRCLLDANSSVVLLDDISSGYPTADGTCTRDCIHVDYVGDAPLLSLEYVARGGATAAFNLSNGSGFSVQQVLWAVKRVAGQSVLVEDAQRRAGDPAVLVASAGKTHDVLSWRPQHGTVDNISRDARRMEAEAAGSRRLSAQI